MARSLSGISLVVLLLLGAGCSEFGPITAGGIDGAAVSQEGIDNCNETADLLATITDQASARAATARLLELDRERDEIRRKLMAFERAATPEQKERLGKRLGRKMKAAGDRKDAEQRRVESIPGVRFSFAQSAAVAAISDRLAAETERSNAEAKREAEAARQQLRQRLQELIQEHGKEQLTTVVIETPSGANRTYVRDKLSDAAQMLIFFDYQLEGKIVGKLIPHRDLKGLAGRIDFGKVTRVDEQERVIHVAVDPSKTPPLLPPTVTDVDDPRFYPQNVAELTCYDRSRRSLAANRLAGAKPVAAHRADVVRGLKAMLTDFNMGHRLAAVEGLGAWLTEDDLPVLFPSLEDENGAVVAAVLRVLETRKDPRSADPVARLLLHQTHRHEAIGCLKALGPSAEMATARYVDHPDASAQRSALDVLREIGTGQCVPRLIEALPEAEVTNRGQIFDIFTRLKDERTAEVTAAMAFAKSGGYSGSQAQTCLKEMGSVAEAATAAYLGHEDRSIRSQVLGVLESIATEQSVPRLIEYLQSQAGPTDAMLVLNILGRIKDERAIPPVAMLLLNTSTRVYAARCLTEYGPAAEETVLKGFDYQDPSLAIECCRILEKIGTQKSFEALMKLTRVRNVSVRSAAQKAGQAIVARVGPPKPPADE